MFKIFEYDIDSWSIPCDINRHRIGGPRVEEEGGIRLNVVCCSCA